MGEVLAVRGRTGEASVTAVTVELDIKLSGERWGYAPMPGGGPTRWTLLAGVRHGHRVIARSHNEEEGEPDAWCVFERPTDDPVSCRWRPVTREYVGEPGDWQAFRCAETAFLPPTMTGWLDRSVAAAAEEQEGRA